MLSSRFRFTDTGQELNWCINKASYPATCNFKTLIIDNIFQLQNSASCPGFKVYDSKINNKKVLVNIVKRRQSLYICMYTKLYTVDYLREEWIFIKNSAQITIKHFSAALKDEFGADKRRISLRWAAPASAINAVVALATGGERGSPSGPRDANPLLWLARDTPTPSQNPEILRRLLLWFAVTFKNVVNNNPDNFLLQFTILV